MNKNIIGVFLILHGIVFSLYGFFDIYPALDQNLSTYQPEMGWAGPSWVFSSFMSDGVVALAAFIAYLVSTLLFVIAGIVFMTDSDWWRISILTACFISSFILIIFWDGSFDKIIDKGVIGLIINVIIAIVAYQK